MGPELQAFLHAWDGSINEVGVPGLAEVAMSFETFAGVFRRSACTCRLPDVLEDLA